MCDLHNEKLVSLQLAQDIFVSVFVAEIENPKGSLLPLWRAGSVGKVSYTNFVEVQGNSKALLFSDIVSDRALHWGFTPCSGIGCFRAHFPPLNGFQNPSELASSEQDPHSPDQWGDMRGQAKKHVSVLAYQSTLWLFASCFDLYSLD